MSRALARAVAGTAMVAAMVAAACGGPRAQPPPASRPRAPVSEPRTPVIDGAMAARPGARRAAVVAPHAGAIAALAVTPDGAAALTADELGGIRLWPALDGTAEPRAVELPVPRALAIGRDPGGFVVAMLDRVGGLVLQRVDGDGLTLARATLPADPAYTGLAMTAAGLLAWREDHRIQRFGGDGQVTSEVAAGAGERVLAIAAAGPRAVAVIEQGRHAGAVTRRARWLALEPALAWGAWIAAGDDVGPELALSPSGTRLAFVRQGPRGGAHAIVIDTATGQQLARVPVEGASAAVAIPTDDGVAVTVPGAASPTWIDVSRVEPSPRPGSAPADRRPAAPAAPVVPAAPAVPAAPFAAGGGAAVGALHGALVIATPAATRYLGYGLRPPVFGAPAPGGRLMIGQGDAFMLLDGGLATVAEPALVPAGDRLAALTAVAGDLWLVHAARGGDEWRADLALVDTARHRTTVLRSGLRTIHALAYEPTTRLATLSIGAAPEVLRVVPDAHRAERVGGMTPGTGASVHLYPVAPALAGGTHVVVVTMDGARVTLRWARDPAALERGPSAIVAGAFAGVDRAGHAYMWERALGDHVLEVVSYRLGARVAAWPGEGTLWPDPRGERVLQLGSRAATLYARDGTRLWALPLDAASEAAWLDDGALVLLGPGGIARLDSATGAVRAARCGWKFGLTDQPPRQPAAIEPLCTQLQ